jgi:1A family penicillin-binding protein
MAAVPIVGMLWVVLSLLPDLPAQDAVKRIGEMDQATTVYDGADQVAFTIFRERRNDVPLSEISPNLTLAVVATEDQRFYDHHGFDVYRIASAAWADIRERRATQGASTITQQLARQSFLKPEKTLRRKVQELLLAVRIEQLYSKSQILELYLNKVYFGDGRYGAEAASRGYFGKSASALTVAEAATLAGLVKAPSSYAPTVNPQRAVARRNLVLQAMLDAGAIDRATWQSARSSRIALTTALPDEQGRGQYFKEEVRQALVDRFGWQRVYQGGLRVFSTIDIKAQGQAEDAVRASLASLTSRRAAIAAKSGRHSSDVDEPLQAALVALDPRTGYVRAMVGGRDFNESHFNRAVQGKRQPGSAFKPFVYATALEMGYSPATVLTGLNDPIATLKGGWTPEDEHSTADSMTLRTALRTSSNRAAVRLLQQVGIPKTVENAKIMGIGDMPAVPSLALGSGEVTLQSMTAAYAAFANHGLVPKPILIRRVEDRDGRILYMEDSVPSRAIKETTAFLMATMLADVINAGTAARARTLGFTLPAAGKTGTTNDFNDAWFVGFTPRLVTGVWVGFDQPRTILPRGFAADVAVPLWTTFMKSATAGDKPEWLDRPAGITTATVCRISGKLAVRGCEDVEVTDGDDTTHRSMVYTDYFVKGSEPTDYCDLHLTVSVLGRIAGLFGVGEKPAPPRIEEAPRRPVQAVAASDRIDTEATATRPKQEKRGFWGRIFHRDDADKNDERARSKRDR